MLNFFLTKLLCQIEAIEREKRKKDEQEQAKLQKEAMR